MHTVSNLNLFLKRLVDLVGSGLGLLLLSPLIVVIVFLIKITMPGHVFFKQERVGKNGIDFHIFKFRTMKIDSEAERNLDFSKDEERTTPLGKLLRRTKIDELPQLINVLVGDMSLVGPRPTVRIQVEEYTPIQMQRLLMKPGMTGLAQVNGNNYISWEQRIEYDLAYIRNYSILLDVKILFKTVAIVLCGEEKFIQELGLDEQFLFSNGKEMEMKSILIGSVDSSKVVLEEMINLKFPVDLVFSLDENYSKNVSGYEPIHELAEAHHIPFRKFKNINEDLHVKEIIDYQPDYIFVIGLSQLIKPEIIHAATIGAIGFHPTPLPKFRGRAALVWQVLLGVRETKCSLFFIDEGMDSGDIIAQEPFVIEDTDYAIDVQDRSNEALKRMMHRVLPQILDGTIASIKQNEEEATYLLKRIPEDGRIDWQAPVETIHRLIRAVSTPYPGAFSYYQGKHKVIFWRADYLENQKYIGIPGQIAQLTCDYIDIVCKDGLLRVTEYEKFSDVQIRAGDKFK